MLHIINRSTVLRTKSVFIAINFWVITKGIPSLKVLKFFLETELEKELVVNAVIILIKLLKRERVVLKGSFLPA